MLVFFGQHGEGSQERQFGRWHNFKVIQLTYLEVIKLHIKVIQLLLDIASSKKYNYCWMTQFKYTAQKN